MFRTAIATLVLSVLAGSSLAADSQSLSEAIAKARAMEMESILQLTAEGAALFQSDNNKLTGYQYCSQAIAFAERGEFRQAIRAASKALFLGQSERNDDVVAHA